MTSLEKLAAAKRLDPGWLREQGVEDLPRGGVGITYRDKDDRILFRRQRDVPGSGKRFNNRKGEKMRPYGLWKLSEHDSLATLYLTEGESDAWALWAEGLPALGVPGDNMAGCVEAHDLAGVEALFVCLDEGLSGRTFRDGVVRRLGQIGYGGRAWALAMPDGAKDVSELRACGRGDFDAKWETVRAGAVAIYPEPAAAAPGEDRPIITRLADVVGERIGYLWQGWMPDGSLCILDGDPGLGKSSLTLDLAARLSRGDALPPLSGRDLGRGPCATLLLGAEDSLKYTVRPRLDAMGADVALIHALEGFTCSDGHERLVILPKDLDRVADFIRQNGVRLVVVDPLMAFLASDTDAHKDQDVRRCLRPLAQLADRLRIVVLLVRHLNKLSGGPALYRGGSSIGITGASRASLIVGRDPNEDRHVLAMNKINVGPNPPSLAYRLEGHGMACRIVWDGEVDLRPDQILGHGAPRNEPGQKDSHRGGRPPTEREKAKTFLADLLSRGRVLTEEVFRRAKEKGISAATLTRARADLGVVPEREGEDVYYMKLPEGTKVVDEPPAPGDDTTDLNNDDDLGYDDNPHA